MIDKQKIDSEVMDILQFQAKTLGLDMFKLDKQMRKLVIGAFIEGVKYYHDEIEEAEEKHE